MPLLAPPIWGPLTVNLISIVLARDTTSLRSSPFRIRVPPPAAPPRRLLMTTHPRASVSASFHSKTISGARALYWSRSSFMSASCPRCIRVRRRYRREPLRRHPRRRRSPRPGGGQAPRRAQGEPSKCSSLLAIHPRPIGQDQPPALRQPRLQPLHEKPMVGAPPVTIRVRWPSVGWGRAFATHWATHSTAVAAASAGSPTPSSTVCTESKSSAARDFGQARSR